MSISMAALRMMIVLKKLQHHICRYVGYNFHILSYYSIFEVCMCVKTRFYTTFIFPKIFEFSSFLIHGERGQWVLITLVPKV